MTQQTRHQKGFYRKYFLWYTILFFILYAVLYGIFKGNGKSFLWDCDGTTQHYPALYYMGDYLKNLVKNVIGMRTEAVPMMDFRLGQGLDVLTTLNYYGFGDPLNLLALIVRQEHLEGLYTALIMIRLYLAGAAFSCYCFTIKRNERGAVLLGAMVYTFSGMSLFAGVRHPFFLNAWIYLPLLLIAAEHMLEKKKYGFFAGIVGLSLISNFYFAYMNTAMVGIYLLFRLFGTKEGSVKEKLITIGKMSLAYIWGVLLSAVVFFPVVYAFLQNARSQDVGGYTASLLHYEFEYYRRFITNYSSPQLWVGSWTILSFSSVCFLAIMLLLHKKTGGKERERYRILKGHLCVFLTFALIPLFGKLLNGNGYVCNRWMYGFAFLNAMIVVAMAPRLIRITKEEGRYLGKCSIGYIVIMLILSKGMTPSHWIGTLCLLATFGMLVYVSRKETYSAHCIYWYVNGVTVITLISYMLAVYLPSMGGYVTDFCNSGSAYKFQQDSPVHAMSEVDDDSFYRVEQPWIMSNQAAVLNYYGNTFYWSVIPQTITEYYDGLALSALDRTYECNSQDARNILNELSSTKYYVTEAGKTGLVPYGYQFIKEVEREDGRVDAIYQNANALSLGYSYDTFIRDSEYLKLSPLERQEALLSCVVIKDSDVTGEVKDRLNEVAATELSFATHKIPATIGSLDGITVQDGKIEVAKPGASMEVLFDGEEGSETYLILKNFKAEYGADYNRLTITSGKDVETTMFLYSRLNAAHYEKEYQGVNLGYSKEKKKSLTITFPSAGTFSYETLEMYSYPMKDYPAKVQSLSDGQLEEVVLSANKVSGTVTTDSEKWMQCSIPYSKGWSVYIDGDKFEVVKSDSAYLGFMLPKGTHAVELRYETPYLKVGAIISFLTALSMGIVIYGKRRKGRAE